METRQRKIDEKIEAIRKSIAEKVEKAKLTRKPHQERTKEEITHRRMLLEKLQTAKHKLASTDYKVIKHYEGWLTDDEFNPIKIEREALRIEIRELEQELEDLKK